MDDLDRFIARLPEEQQAEIRADLRAKLDALRTLTLAELRKDRRVTQVDLAAELGRAQYAVSRLERGGDTKVSTLRRHVEALGGRLALVATFGDEVYAISGFDEADQNLAESA